MDKVILITGASSGIGEGIARELAARGAKVLMGARRTDRLDAIAADLRGSGGEVATWSLDVTDIASMQDFAQAALNLFDDTVTRRRLEALFAGFADELRADTGGLAGEAVALELAHAGVAC